MGAKLIFNHFMNYQYHLPSENGLNHSIQILSSNVGVCEPNLEFSNLDHFRMLGWHQNDPLIILGLVQVLVCAGVQVLVDKI